MIGNNDEMNSLENKCQQLLTRLINSKCKSDFIDKTKVEIQKLSANIAQQYDRSKYGEFDTRLNEIENEITHGEITRKKDLVIRLSALKSRAEMLLSKNSNFHTRILQEINDFLNETDLTKIENGLQRIDNIINLEETKFENFQKNEGVRENLKTKCQSLLMRLEKKTSENLYTFSKMLFADLWDSVVELSNFLNESSYFDSNYIELNLLELDKKANDGENLISLESMHNDLNERFNKSYCDNEFFKNIK
jgi:hypothetical protein